MPTKNEFQTVIDEVDVPIAAPTKKVKREETLVSLDLKQKTLAQIYTAQKKYPVRIAPSYARYFGNIMRIVINGIAIAVRCNGETYMLPEDFAAEAERRMREMDTIELKSRKMADFKGNYEPDIGSLSFF